MLVHLAIRDFVIVEALELSFKPGFTVLTGETGAGKSILIDALNLALGERAEAGVVRPGARRAEVAAEFSLAKAPHAAQWLADNDLQGEAGECLARRVVEAEGRSRAFVNGRAATLQQLRELGDLLVDVHGQFANQSLLKAVAQQQLLDDYGGLSALAQALKAAFQCWQALQAQRLEWEKNSAAIADERDLLERQVGELAVLGFEPRAWEEELNEHKRLTHAASLIEGAQQALDALSEGEGASVPVLDGVIQRLRPMAEYDGQLQEALTLLDSAVVQAREGAYALRRYADRLELDPGRLRELEERISLVHATARRLRVTPGEVPGLLARARARLEELGGQHGVEDLRRREQDAHAQYLVQAKKLSAGREKAAKALAGKVTDAMQALAMVGGKLVVHLATRRQESAQGLEQVEFRVSAHKGVEPGPIEKVVSGGELSRIGLAIQVVASNVTRTPSLIFDEVDSGIGGGVAEIVGRLLLQLGSERQVMCVTHLPQVAARAQQHWKVAKDTRGNAVVSTVEVLDKPRRIEEIARMLGGVVITAATRQHAAEMLGDKLGQRKIR
jgi:DNA repair protein RecN (Recombination protein N)